MAGILVTFVCIWWLLWFMLLPWGVKVPSVTLEGHATSAPKNPHLRIKFLICTGVSAVATAVFHYALNAGWLGTWETL